ncbi:hypothetical protein J7E99_35735 [Streptomyces sp. ISL-44]|uniref:hypothetical protein n=1 Tax=unclassified Streptomyces TaxID=2593676 RepID=UPI001BE91651|nr:MULTISPECIES: hypothetical protein [unclassified Streptomyces]MBT2545876.1 hypothetical protein [Streptomyces sp. ISL-44]MCX5016090.1 hypothetical protein [Streptomyces sp. NBC_00555]MCX5609279.1 hypothetical protein [Streptomyces sp. NBC_00047]UUU43207.1 hypothetical protein JIW86_32970 [Streptomyces sp. NBC_00162]
MSGIVVVYEVDQPDLSVRRVHAAPAAPGTTSVPGPRTFCGRDTFAMETAPWTPSADPGATWYPPQHADLMCAACDDAAS